MPSTNPAPTCEPTPSTWRDGMGCRFPDLKKAREAHRVEDGRTRSRMAFDQTPTPGFAGGVRVILPKAIAAPPQTTEYQL